MYKPPGNIADTQAIAVVCNEIIHIFYVDKDESIFSASSSLGRETR